MKRYLVLLCVGVTVLATIFVAFHIAMPEKIVLTLKQDDQYGEYKDVTFYVGENLDNVCHDLTENSIEYAVVENKDIIALSCFSVELVNYKIIVFSGRIDRIEAESDLHGRGVIIPKRYHD